MLKQSVIDAATTIFRNADYQEKHLIPLPNTPLALMVRTLTGIQENGSDQEILYMSSQTTSTEGNFSDVKHTVAKKVARVMGNIISTAKNEINPHCRAIIKQIEELREGEKLVRGKLDVEIAQIDMPELFADALFQQLIDPYKNVILALPEDINFTLKRLNGYFTSDELLLLLQTGSSSLDARIAKYTNGNIGLFSCMEDAGSIPYLTLRDATLFFLLLTGIKNGKLDKGDALVNTPKTNADLSTLRGLLGRKIYNDVNKLEQDIKRGIIFTSGSYLPAFGTKTIAVLGKPYRDWVANKGGSPEAVLGYYITNQFNTHLTDTGVLSQDPEFYVKIYNKHLQFIKSLGILKDQSIVRTALADYINDVIRKSDEDVDRAALQLKLKNALELDYHGSTVLHTYVIKVVCLVFTDGNSVRDLLLAIDNILIGMEEPDLTYAIYMGSIKLVAQWLASQVTLEK